MIDEYQILPMKISTDDWPSSKQYIQLSTGSTMTYVEMGDPFGQEVIILHGLMDTSFSWSLAANFLCQSGYHIYLPELKEMQISDLEAFFDEMDMEEVILIGHSSGGLLAQLFAQRNPSRCSKLVLVSTVSYDDWQEYVDAVNKNVDQWYKCDLKEDNEEIEYEKFISYLKEEAKDHLMDFDKVDLEGFKPGYDYGIPVLVLYGEDDVFISSPQKHKVLSELKTDEMNYRDYMEAGHNIQFEIPEQCSIDILYWLEYGALPY